MIRNGLRSVYHSLYRIFSDDTIRISVDGIDAYIQNTNPIVSNRIRGLEESNRRYIQAVLDELEEDDVFWDIGAHVGRYSCICGQVARKTISVEAHPDNVEVLKQNIDHNEIPAEIIWCALTDEDGTISFSSQHNSAGEFFRGAEVNEEGGQVDVSARRVDSLSHENPDILRMDVTGAEPNVIDGTNEDFFESVRLVLVHTYPDRYQDPGAVQNRLESEGFTVKHLSERVVIGT